LQHYVTLVQLFDQKRMRIWTTLEYSFDIYSDNVTKYPLRSSAKIKRSTEFRWPNFGRHWWSISISNFLQHFGYLVVRITVSFRPHHAPKIYVKFSANQTFNRNCTVKTIIEKQMRKTLSKNGLLRFFQTFPPNLAKIFVKRFVKRFVKKICYKYLSEKFIINICHNDLVKRFVKKIFRKDFSKIFIKKICQNDLSKLFVKNICPKDFK